MARKFLSGVSTNAFQLGTSATSGQVLTTDSSGNGTWQPASGGGTGDVVGPAGAADNGMTRFDTTTGKLIQDSPYTVSDIGVIAAKSGNAFLQSSTGNSAYLQSGSAGPWVVAGATGVGISGGPLSMNTHQINDVTDPTLAQDAATKNYVDAGVTTFTGAKTFNNGKLIVAGSTSGTTILNATAAASGTLTFPAATSTLAGLAIAQTWTAAQSFNSGNLKLNGATSGTTTLNAAPTAGTTTATLPATTGNILVDAATQTNTAAKTFNSSTMLLAGATSGTTTLNATAAASGVLTLPAATDTLVGRATADNLTNKTFDSTSPTAFMYPGFLQPYAGRTAPTGWLLCDGSAVSRTTFASLFSALSPSLGTVTITIATPAVVTKTTHGMLTGDSVYLTTTGALPTGLTVNTLYYVIRIDANSFNLATSRANAYAATKIATSGTQSGTHTAFDCPYGLGDGSTTFNVPDSRGRILAGADGMGGTVASRLTLAQSQGSYGNIGSVGGSEAHTLTLAQMASHVHGIMMKNDGSLVANSLASYVSGNTWSFASTGGTFGKGFGTGDGNTITAGSDGAHNNVQPTLVVSYIIKT